MDSVYDRTTRVYVLPFLTRKYGIDVSEEYLKNKNIPSSDMEYIIKFVLPKSPKHVPELDLNNEQTCVNAKRFMIRMYGDELGMEKYKNQEFSVYDKKMIRTMNMLNRTYNQSCLERKSIESSEFMNEEPSIKSSLTQETLICKAFKMNGEKCTAKAKLNGLCMRHSKKV